MTTSRPWVFSLALLCSVNAPLLARDHGLTLADLEAYRAALVDRTTGPVPTVRFRDLWDHPEAHAGKPVAVAGRIARLFRQPAVGEFPPLVEAWVVSSEGDPLCVVFPGGEAAKVPEVGTSVRFTGTFLRRVEYHSGDVPRLAPLIVGPRPPTAPPGAPETEGLAWSSGDWMMATGACVVVGWFLARRHLARPLSRRPLLDPPPLFVDGESREIEETP